MRESSRSTQRYVSYLFLGNSVFLHSSALGGFLAHKFHVMTRNNTVGTAAELSDPASVSIRDHRRNQHYG